jgi:hypothetical protein
MSFYAYIWSSLVARTKALHRSKCTWAWLPATCGYADRMMGF